ncbi:MAG: hypothetical protein ACYTF6_01440 [Planctomycetota bacterium]|jgi:hypothetical protein
MIRLGKMESIPVLFFLSAIISTSIGCKKQPEGRATTRPAPEASAASDRHPLPPWPLSRPYVKTEIRLAGNIRDVFVYDKNLTNFPRPHHIYSVRVSPDDEYVLVWHMDYPPRQVSIYELESFRKISTFGEGHGGEICWADYDLIYHQYGAGTNTALFAVYSLTGEKLWEGFSSGAHLCESGQHVFVYPTLSNTEEEILVADVRNGDVIGRARPEDIACTEKLIWVDGVTVRAWYRTLDESIKSVDIRIDPDHRQKWDAVFHVEML